MVTVAAREVVIAEAFPGQTTGRHSPSLAAKRGLELEPRLQCYYSVSFVIKTLSNWHYCEYACFVNGTFRIDFTLPTSIHVGLGFGRIQDHSHTMEMHWSH
jgi:hypothetical protein